MLHYKFTLLIIFLLKEKGIYYTIVSFRYLVGKGAVYFFINFNFGSGFDLERDSFGLYN